MENKSRLALSTSNDSLLKLSRATMEVLVPQKRSTPPPTEPNADPTLSPSVSKQPRLDATLSSEPAKAEVTIQGFKVPKAFRGIEEWGPTEIGPMETTYLSTQFEVDDSSECESSRSIQAHSGDVADCRPSLFADKEALLALEGLLAKSAYPTRFVSRISLPLPPFVI